MEIMTLTNCSTQISEIQSFPGYINDFISWIDRGTKTTRTYLTNLRQFLAWMRYSGIQSPNRQDVINYREWLSSEHDAIIATVDGWQFRTDAAGNQIQVTCKPYTVKQYLQSVRQFFKWLGDFGYYPNVASNVHTPRIKGGEHKKDALTPKEVYTIEKSIITQAETKTANAATNYKDSAGRVQRSTEQGKRLFAMYVLAVNAGLRTVEISRANIKDIETKSGKTYIYIWGKGCSGPEQKKVLTPEVVNALYDYINVRSDCPTQNSPLFVSTGNRSRGKRIATTTISTMLKQAMKEAGFNSERLTAHSLRHSTGTAIMSLTGDIYIAQKYMRHSSPATTEIYIHETEAAEQESAALAQGLYDLFHNKTKEKE